MILPLDGYPVVLCRFSIYVQGEWRHVAGQWESENPVAEWFIHQRTKKVVQADNPERLGSFGLLGDNNFSGHIRLEH